MPATVLVGMQWGDEGKGKIVHLLAPHYSWVVRYQGGPNAGHTVIDDRNKFVMHRLPSGILYKGVRTMIANGVSDVQGLAYEIGESQSRGIDVTPYNLVISTNVHAILDHHIEADKSALSKGIGTTRRGIGPAYSDKAARRGIRFGDLLYADIPGVYDELCDRLNELGYENPKRTLNEILRGFEAIKPHVQDGVEVVHDALRKGENILCEGAQGTFLDVDHGTYRFVTSSNTTAGAASTYIGIGPAEITEVIGVMKAYTTRVGEGPFPTEQKNETGERLQKNGGEVGATTSRKRRCGWLDLVMLRRAVELNVPTYIALTKLDVLDQEETIRAATSYKIGNSITDIFPPHHSLLDMSEPIYRDFEGWRTSTRDTKRFDDLPKNAQSYIEELEHELDERTGRITPIDIISVGEDKRQTILVDSKLQKRYQI